MVFLEYMVFMEYTCVHGVGIERVDDGRQQNRTRMYWKCLKEKTVRIIRAPERNNEREK